MGEGSTIFLKCSLLFQEELSNCIVVELSKESLDVHAYYICSTSVMCTLCICSDKQAKSILLDPNKQ